MAFSTVGTKQVRGRHLATGDNRGNQFDNKTFRFVQTLRC